MTEKRFTSMYNGQSDMIQYVDTLKEEPNKWSICNVSETLKKLNELHEENQQLRKSLKRELMAMSGNLCDACKHEEEDNTNNWLVGIDFDVKCRKGHEILLDDEEQECEDFELRLEDLE